MKNSIFLQLLISTITQFPVCADAQNNVGIGTTTPLTKLTVQTPTGHYGITHTDGTTTVGTYIGIGKAWFGTTTNQPLAFFTNNSNEQVTLLTNGNLGIGTATPSTKLTVRTPNNTDGFEHISDGGIVMRSRVGGTSATIGTVTNHTFRLTANNVPHLNLEPNGNIGVGVTDAAYRMDIVDRIRIRSGIGTSAGLWLNNPGNTATVAFLGIKAVDLVGMYGNVSGWGLAMNTNTGDLAVGSQNPLAGYKLSVYGNSYVSGLLYTTGDVEVGGDIQVSDDLTVVDEVTADTYYTNGWRMEGLGSTFIINGWGTQFELFDGEMDCYGISDKKLKKDIQPLPSVLQSVLKLNPTQYYFKSDTACTRLSMGFIAQEVKEIFPHVVHTRTHENGTTSLSLAYRQFSILAIKAIQEQQLIIVDQQTQIDDMQARLATLERILRQ